MPAGGPLLRANFAVVRGSLLGSDRLRLGAIALLLALGLLGALQYRWLREVADAQRSRMKSDAAARAAAIAQDFDREITRAFLMLQFDSEAVRSRDVARFAERHAEFRRVSRWPDLVREVLVYEPNAQGGVTLLRFSPERRALEPAEWPADLEVVKQALAGNRPGIPFVPGIPALVSPVAEPLTTVATATRRSDKLLPITVGKLMLHRGSADGSSRLTIVVLDRQLIAARVLPELVARHLDAAGGEFEASIIDDADLPVFGSAPTGTGDAHVELLRLRYDDIDTAILKSFIPEVTGMAVRREHFSVRFAHGDAGPAKRWRLVLRHKRGSIDRAVSAVLARNVAVAFSVLGILGASIILIAASARRARTLAARQMEFVAGVSHELRTPLAVIRSAGENLADGVVSDPSQVRRYGGLVRDEGLRLSEMVEQVLSFAGAHALPGERKRLDLAAVVERALAAEAREGFAFERDIAPGLPAVIGDAPALERAIANLLSNARKYGGPERKVAISVRVLSEGQVAVTVSDQGPGIEAGERERLFEPFFRGRRAREAQAPGSGLGLAIVRRIAEGHGGRVEVVSEPGRGASFTIVLPAAPAADAAAASDVQTHPAG